jgi:hypothetical protein
MAYVGRLVGIDVRVLHEDFPALPGSRGPVLEGPQQAFEIGLPPKKHVQKTGTRYFHFFDALQSGHPLLDGMGDIPGILLQFLGEDKTDRKRQIPEFQALGAVGLNVVELNAEGLPGHPDDRRRDILFEFEKQFSTLQNYFMLLYRRLNLSVN